MIRLSVLFRTACRTTTRAPAACIAAVLPLAPAVFAEPPTTDTIVVHISYPDGTRAVRTVSLPAMYRALAGHRTDATSPAPAAPLDYRLPAGTSTRITHAGATSAGSRDPDWSTFFASTDTRIVYVSSSEGDDANTGLSPSSPLRTLAAGIALLRDGYPDWLLLKRGDTWFDESLGTWTRSGRSSQQPMVISSYGDGIDRPVIASGDQPALRHLGDGVEHVAFVGLDFYAHRRDPLHPAFSSTAPTVGIEWIGPSTDVLFEDCAVRFYKDNLSFQSDAAGRPADVRLRGCIVTDAYAVGVHAQGLYAAGVDGLLIEQSVFDHNGWNEHIAGAEPTIFNHNIYVLGGDNAGPSRDVVVRGCIIANAANFGCNLSANAPATQLDPLVERNLFVRNANGLVHGSATDAGVVGAVVRSNVFTELGREFPGLGLQSLAIDLDSAADVIIERNIFAHKPAFGGSASVSLDSPALFENIAIRNNVVFNWHAGKIIIDGSATSNVLVYGNGLFSTLYDTPLQVLRHGPASGLVYTGNIYFRSAGSNEWFLLNDVPLSLPQWINAVGESDAVNGAGLMLPDPSRTVATYHASIGGEPTVEAFLAEARKQSSANWRPQYAADAVVDYFIAGYALPVGD